MVSNISRFIQNRKLLNSLVGCHWFTNTIFAKQSCTVVGLEIKSQFVVQSTVSGKIKVKGCGDIKISPAKYSENGNSSYCTVSGESGFTPELIDNNGKMLFSIKSNGQQPLDIEVPHHYDVAVENEGDAVTITVENMESESVSVKGKTANCILDNLKGMKTDICLESGSVTFKKGFIGNVTTSLKEGKVTASRIQGGDICIHVGEGSINLTSLYSSNQTDISCGHGDVKIGSCHGSTRAFLSKGDFTSDSVDGELLASLLDEGSIDVHLSQHKNVQLLASKGCVNVSMGAINRTNLDAVCEELITDDKVLFHITDRDEKSTRVEGVVMGSADLQETVSPSSLPLVKVQSKTLSLTVKEWISTFKFSGDS